MIKKIIIIWTIQLVIFFVGFNYRLLTDPDREMMIVLAEENYSKWKLDFLIWEGADVTANDGAAFEAMIVFKHYSLIELFASKVPEDKRKMMYELTLKYQLPEDIDKRLRKALKINTVKTTRKVIF